jgi:ribosomal protein S18 acetylase RimI-like enzyme
MINLRIVERLEQFWYNLVLTMPSVEKIDGATVTCYPELPTFHYNHAAIINVKNKDAEALLERVTKHFQSRNFPYTCFRISPLTRPKTFTSLLEKKGFKRKLVESVMVFKGKQPENKLDLSIKVEEISESKIDVYSDLFLENFEMPMRWKSGIDRLALNWMEQGWKCYLAYAKKKPVGTCLLLSLNRTGGIFNVGTLKKYRRLGIGTALTVRALTDSIDEGNSLHILEAKKGGNAEHLYKKIGFEIDHTISYFAKENIVRNVTSRTI